MYSITNKLFLKLINSTVVWFMVISVNVGAPRAEAQSINPLAKFNRSDEVEVSRGPHGESVYHAPVCSRSHSKPGQIRCHSHFLTDSSGEPLQNLITPATLPIGFGPSDLRSAYNITANGASNTTIAIVDAFDDPTAESDLAAYRQTYNLPAMQGAPCAVQGVPCFQKLNQAGQPSPLPASGVSSNWDLEASLDIEMASAICPNCNITLIEANDDTSTISGTPLYLSENTAITAGANVVSNSWGGPESSSDSTSDTSYFMHLGVPITFSSGDSGYGVEYPASSQFVTAVGGTSLSRDLTTARGWTETAWSGAGSGCSAHEPKPAWQLDSGCTNRMVADVSAVADVRTPVAVYARSTWIQLGGTSVAAPIIAGVYALNGGSTAGYGSDPYKNPNLLFDVSSGSNGTCNNKPPYFCNAVSGYDGPTGLGTPNGIAAFQGVTSFTVTTTADTNDGACTAAQCSLRDAINAANILPQTGNAAINFAIPPSTDSGCVSGVCTIALTSQTSLPQLTGNVTIDGSTENTFAPGHTIAIDGGAISAPPGVQIMHVASTADVALSNLTLQNANNSSSIYGGAIYNEGNLSVESSAFMGNVVTTLGGGGGAIANGSGTLTVNNSSFSNNSATGLNSGNGGAIASAGGTVKVTGTSFSNNFASDQAGALGSQTGTVTITSSIFTGNIAAGLGAGALGNDVAGTMNVVNCTFSENKATSVDSFNPGNAGAIGNKGILTVTGSTFNNNTAANAGGAIGN